LLKDFNALIKNEMLNPLKIQYKDYSEWQNSKEQKNKIQFQRKYWLNIFNKDWAPINLPTDFNRPEVLTTEDGTTVGTVYYTSNVEKIRKLTQHNNISVFMFFHTVINIFLNKITGQSDFSIGTYTFGRNMPDLENIVGVFINHVVVRNKFQIDSDFKSFLKKTSERIIESFENQEYPYENLVNDLDLKRQSNHNPIFDIAVNYQEYNSEISEMEEKSFLTHKKGGGGVDLSFQILDFGEKIVLAIEYCDKLFMPQTIDRYLYYINTIVDTVLNNPNVKLSEIRIIDTPQINNESKSDVVFEF
jgi:non-ribosomal peptide synthetase component F